MNVYQFKSLFNYESFEKIIMNRKLESMSEKAEQSLRKTAEYFGSG